MKAQSSFEYLMVLGIALGILVPVSYLFYNHMASSSSDMIYPQVSEIGMSIVQNSESIFFSGEGSKVVLDLQMPSNIETAYILFNRELVFNVSTHIGVNEMVFFSNVNITSSSCSNEVCLINISQQGVKKVKLESINAGKQVLISKYDEN